MRRPSREISVFNVSALDLFASALGAFILISVVLFPFFPNTSTARKALPHVDLVICLDVTGSMGEQIEGLRTHLESLVRVMTVVAPSVGVGVVAFGDRTWAGRMTPARNRWASPSTRGVTLFFDIEDVTGGGSRLDGLRTFLQSLNAGMVGPRNDNFVNALNLDNEEALYTALRQAIGESSWRPQAAARMVLVITDNPAYEEEWEVSMNTARGFAAGGQGFRVSTVIVQHPAAQAGSPAIGSHPGTRAFLQRLATEGSGRAIDSTQSIIADILESIN